MKGTELRRRPARPSFRRLSAREQADQRCVEELIMQMGPRDRRAAAFIVSHVGDVAVQQGQKEALALVEEIIRIIQRPDVEH